jgi:hypothetical protein
MEEPEEQQADVYTEENEAAASAEDTVGDSFDVDFGMEEPEEQRADAHIVEDAGSNDVEAGLVNIPEKQQTVDAAASENAAPLQVDTRSTELLLKIVDELSTIKSELSRLKDEISNIRESAAAAAIQTGDEADLYDDSETLSGKELEMVLKNASVDLKKSEYITGKRASELDAEFLHLDDTAAQINEVNSPAEDMSESPGMSVDLDLREEESYTNAFGTEAEAALPETLEERITVPSLPQDEADIADYLSPDDKNAIAADENDVLNDMEPLSKVEPEPAAPSPVEIESEPPLTPPKPSKPSPARVVPQSEPLVKPPKPSPAPDTSQSETHEQTDARALPPQVEQGVMDSKQFKKELQVVLSYMDRLLESLPDEKIEEFARSKQFDVYKKVFKELGLV